MVDQGLATSAGAYDRSDALDYPTFHLAASPRQGVELAAVEQAMQAEIDKLVQGGVTEEELRLAKDRLQASAIFARDEHVSAMRMLAEVELALGDTAAATTAIERALSASATRPEWAGRLAKARLQASAILARDEPSTGPHVIGAAMATGETLEHIQSWPERVEAVTVEQVNALLREFLKPERSVTGYLLPQEPS